MRCLQAWSPDSHPTSTCTNDLDIIHNKTQGSILPWPCHNLVLPTPSRTSTWEASADETSAWLLPRRANEAHRVKGSLTVVITETAGGYREVPATQHHIHACEVQFPPESISLTHICTDVMHLCIVAGTEWASIKFAGRNVSQQRPRPCPSRPWLKFTDHW